MIDTTRTTAKTDDSKKIIGLMMSAELAERLKKYKKRAGATQKFVIERALTEYLDKMEPLFESEE